MTNLQKIEAAKKYVAENGIELAALTGTKKQIEWASDLRYTAIGTILQCGTPRKELLDMFNGKTSAAWWIEHEDYVTTARCIAIAFGIIK